MTDNPQHRNVIDLLPRITVCGVGGGGGNAVNNMINAGLQGVDFVVVNTDAQALAMSKAEKVIQIGMMTTEGLGAGASAVVGAEAANESIQEIMDNIGKVHMLFITAGMGGGTGTGAAPVIAKAAKEKGILTVGVVTKPFDFEGARRQKTAEAGIQELQKHVDTLLVIPNQNLFTIADDKTTFAQAFSMADQVLYSAVASITDLMVKEGLINLDFADVQAVMHEMGRAMMGTAEATGPDRALDAANAAINNPLLDERSVKGAQGLLISITGGSDMTLFEVDAAATRIREEVDGEANVIFGAIHDDSLNGYIRVSVVATGIPEGGTLSDKTGGGSGGTSPSQNSGNKLGSSRPSGGGASAHAEEPAPSMVQNTSPNSVLRALHAAQETDDFLPKSQLFVSSAVKDASEEKPVLIEEPQEEEIKKEEVQKESFENFGQAVADNLEKNMQFLAQHREELKEQIQSQLDEGGFPPLEDFPNIVQKAYKEKFIEQPSAISSKGQRSLWQKLRQSFSFSENASNHDIAARLEPVADLESKWTVEDTNAQHRSVRMLKTTQAEKLDMAEEDQPSLDFLLRQRK